MALNRLKSQYNGSIISLRHCLEQPESADHCPKISVSYWFAFEDLILYWHPRGEGYFAKSQMMTTPRSGGTGRCKDSVRDWGSTRQQFLNNIRRHRIKSDEGSQILENQIVQSTGGNKCGLENWWKRILVLGYFSLRFLHTTERFPALNAVTTTSFIRELLTLAAVAKPSAT